MPLAEGQIILNGKYRILRLIGQGAFARVWLAQEPDFGGRLVAIKELKREQLSPDQVLAQERCFLREVELGARLTAARATHVAQAITVERWRKERLLVLEYTEGGSLADLLARHPQGLPLEQALGIVQDLCQALGALHSLPGRPVHRDLKPTNVLLGRDGRGLLSDFGLAQTEESLSSMGMGEHHPGTSGYMSPEQERTTGYLTAASDLYALGCVLFEMLTGQRYQGERPGTPVTALRRDAPAWLDGVLSRVLQEDPWQRYASAAEMAGALRGGLEEWARAQAEARRQAEESALAKADAKARAEVEQQAAQARLEEEARRQEAEARAQAQAEVRADWEYRRRAAEQKAEQARLEEETRTKEAKARAQSQARARAEEEQRRRAAEQQAAQARLQEEAKARAEEERRRRASRWRTWAWVSVTVAALALVLLGTGGRGPLAPVFARPRATPTAVRTQATLTPARPGGPTFTSPPPPTAGPAGPQPGSTRVLDKAGITLVYVPAGEFVMGSTDADVDEALALCQKADSSCDRSSFTPEQPQHRVYLDGYWMGRTEVTNAQYRKFIAAGGYSKREYWSDEGWAWRESRGVTQPQYWNDETWNKAEYPAVGVSWYEAAAYAKWAGARLPTEAEWEKAARGADGRIYPWGNDWDGTRLNFCDKNCVYDWKDTGVDDGYAYTAPVGHYPSGASRYGALDTAGNVWEWCEDWYNTQYYGQPSGKNPSGPTSGTSRVLRSGSWSNYQRSLRCVDRGTNYPDLRHYFVGFRVAG